CARARVSVDRVRPEEIEILLDGGAIRIRGDHEAPEDVEGHDFGFRCDGGPDEQGTDRELGIRARGEEDLTARDVGRGRGQHHREDPGGSSHSDRSVQAGPGWVSVLRLTCAWTSRTRSPSS